MTPLEQYREARRAVALAHSMLAAAAPPVTFADIFVNAAVKGVHAVTHDMLRRARRRLVLSALATILSSLIGLATVWLLLLASIALFEQITNR